MAFKMSVLSKIAPRGSVLWLGFHQLRREFRFKKASSGTKAMIGRIVIGLFLILVCISSGMAFKTMIENNLDLKTMSGLVGTKIVLSFFGLIFMSFLTSAAYLTDKSDLDLLISAPIDPKKIIKARLLVSSWRTTSVFLYMYSIFLLLAAITISPKYFTYIPISLGLSLAEAGFVFFITRFILISFGLKLGRNILITIGVLGLIGFATLFQINNIQNNINEAIIPQNNQNIFIDFFGNAILGNWLNAFIILFLGVAIFTIALEIVGSSFAKDIGLLVGQDNTENKKTKSIKSKSFSKNKHSIFIKKELYSITREPMIWVQLIAPLIGFIPLIFLIIKEKDSHFIGLLSVPFIVFIISTIASTIAWMIMSVEEARDLLVSAPISNNKILMNKGYAAAFIPLALLILFSLGFLFIDPKLLLYSIGFGVLTIICSIGAEFTHPKISKRPKMMQKPDRSMIGIAYSIIFAIIWAIISALATFNLLWGLIATIIALIISAILIIPEFNKKSSEEKLLGVENI